VLYSLLTDSVERDIDDDDDDDIQKSYHTSKSVETRLKYGSYSTYIETPTSIPGYSCMFFDNHLYDRGRMRSPRKRPT